MKTVSKATLKRKLVKEIDQAISNSQKIDFETSNILLFVTQYLIQQNIIGGDKIFDYLSETADAKYMLALQDELSIYLSMNQHTSVLDHYFDEVLRFIIYFNKKKYPDQLSQSLSKLSNSDLSKFDKVMTRLINASRNLFISVTNLLSSETMSNASNAKKLFWANYPSHTIAMSSPSKRLSRASITLYP